MGRQYTGKQITRTAEVKQKNGDTYVYERVYQYDRDKKKTVVVSNRLIGKRRAGESEIVPTGSPAAADKTVARAGARSVPPEEAGREQTLPAAAEPAETGSDNVRRVSSWSGSDESSGMLTSAELRDYAEQCSGIARAAELCLPPSQAQPLLEALWDAFLLQNSVRERPAEASGSETLRELLHKARGLIATLLRIRLLKSADLPLTLIAVRGERGSVFFRGGDRLLGVRELPEMLSMAAGVDAVWENVGAGDLLTQQVYLEDPIESVNGIDELERHSLPFICPLDLDSACGERLLAETATARRKPQTEAGSMQAWTFPLRRSSGTLQLCSEAEAELWLHVYVSAAEREAESTRFEKQLRQLRKLLEEGTSADDLNCRARALRRRFLHADEHGGWRTDQEAVYRHTEKLGCLMLITNGTNLQEEALTLHRDAEQSREWLSRLRAEGKSLSAEILIGALRESLEDLIASARQIECCEHGMGLERRLVEDAAKAYLENADLGEVLAMLLADGDGSDAARARKTSVSELLRRAYKKAASALNTGAAS